MPIGIFDSGLGGLTIFDSISKRHPEIGFVYYGDNHRAPYGVRNQNEIFQFTCDGVNELWNQGCQLVILACNTASAVSLRKLQEEIVSGNKRVLGIFVPTIETIIERNWGDNSAPRETSVNRVALFATPATVASRAFQRELSFRAIGVDVESQPCGGLVDAIEEGDIILAEAIAKSHAEALLRRMPNPQVAVLGCTHYPIVEKAFQEALGQEVRIINQSEVVADSLADYLQRNKWIEYQYGDNKFITSGNPSSVSNRATLFLKRSIQFT
ncbi:MAG: glutamate racemase [Rhodobacteraceae bacterium]|nr:glutamate racemase [Paracoccaceae bacterium]